MGLNMSRAHYEAEIKVKKENRRGEWSLFLPCSLLALETGSAKASKDGFALDKKVL